MVDVRADIEQRLERVQAAIDKQGLGGLLIYSHGRHNMGRMDQLLYLSDFRSVGPCVLVVPRSGSPTLLVSPPWDAARAGEAAGVREAKGVDFRDLAELTGREAAKLGKPLGLAGRDVMPVGFGEELFEELGDEPADAEKLVPSLGMCRTPAELERVEMAGRIADIGFQAACDTARVGMREYELAAEVEAAMQKAGAEDNFGLIGGNAHNQAVRPATDRRLEEGDLIIGEITPCYKGYVAQLCRTLVLGKPTAVQQEKFELLIEAETQGLEAARAGRPSGEIARAVDGVIGAAGYEEYCKPPYMRTRGHGLGMGGIAPADLTQQSASILENNMTFVIHPNQYLPETGYMMVGDTVVIDDGAARRLTQTPLQLFWKAV